MEFFIVGLHVVLCFFLILVVLLQPGKGADFGAAMGGSSQDVFGATGSVTLLTKLTAIVAGLFMATSLAMAWFSTSSARGDGTLDLDDLVEEAGSEATPTTDGATDPVEADTPEPVTEPAADDDDSANVAPTGDADPEAEAAPVEEPADSSSAEPEAEAAPVEEPAEAPAEEPAEAPAEEPAPAEEAAPDAAPAGDPE